MHFTFEEFLASLLDESTRVMMVFQNPTERIRQISMGVIIILWRMQERCAQIREQA